MRRGMVQPNIGESGSKSAARALELCPRLKLTSRTELRCAAAKHTANLYFRVIQNTIVFLIASIDLIYGMFKIGNCKYRILMHCMARF